MSLFEPKKPDVPSKVSKEQQDNSNSIKVFDEFGRELLITKEDWRTKVLPGSLKSNWNDPDKLSPIIIGSLDDNLAADVRGAAEHLWQIDTNAARGACVYAIVLMKTGDLDGAERVLQSYLDRHGDEGSVLTNLAKVYSSRNQAERAEQTLWHAIEVDPNQANGLLWYLAIQREKSGESGAHEALCRIAALPTSWRAQLWLARTAIAARDLDKALALYREALARIPGAPQADLLMQISGDLGNGGYLRELLTIVEPSFVPQLHGLQVGNNLIKAHLDLGEVEQAKRVLEQLYELQRPDFKAQLGFWETEIGKAKIAQNKRPDSSEAKVGLNAVLGPIWLSSASSAPFIPAKPPESQLVSFLGSTAESSNAATEAKLQLADSVGRMSRSLPLFLAEQIWCRTFADVQTLVPTITGNGGALVLGGVPWSDEAAARYALMGTRKSELIAVTHLNCKTQPWTVQLRLVRSSDGQRIEEDFALLDPLQSQAGATELARALEGMVARAGVKSQTPPSWFEVPTGPNFNSYLLRLEQLLCVRCSFMDGFSPEFLHGPREIVDGNLQLCVASPKNVLTRILLAQTVSAMKRVRSDVVAEFEQKVVRLQNKEPLPDRAQEFVQSILDRVFESVSPRA